MVLFERPACMRIVFFTGTGGTKMAAMKLAEALTGRGVTVYINELTAQKAFSENERVDMLIVLFPVYAFNAPGPVYEYIKNRPRTKGLIVAVISVSGGGELLGNKASRLHAIRLLQKNGCQVIYEKMLIMPANAIAATPKEATFRLLQILPEKANQIAEDLVAGITQRAKIGLVSRLLAALGEIEKKGAGFFGRSILADERCISCGVCAEMCPTGNIYMEKGKPVFGNKCTTCLRCIYGCPERALEPHFFKKLVLKEGFDLEQLKDGMSGFKPVEDVKYKGAWKALGPYFEKDG